MNWELQKDGELLSKMRDNGCTDEYARELIEAVRVIPYKQSQWESVQFHADMHSEFITARSDGYEAQE